jgi:hypothetical protein
MNGSASEEDVSKRESSKERRKRQRETKKLKDKFLYEETSLERAKAVIARQEVPDIGFLLIDPEFAGKFSDKEILQLKNFVSNTK